MTSEEQKWAFEPPQRFIYRQQGGHRPDPRLMGDSGPWIKHIPAMWQALAGPTGGHSYPAAPKGSDLTWPPYAATAYWAPLPHLLRHSFGWRSPSWHPGWNRDETKHMALGLQRLLQKGPDSPWLADPRVRFVLAAWGIEHLAAFATWAVGEHPAGTDGSNPPSPAVRALVEGGNDPLHLGAHWDAPLKSMGDSTSRRGEPHVFATDSSSGSRRGLLLLDTYAAWSAQLGDSGDQLEHALSEIDVVVQPVGWLGRFRRSPDTGLWFSGDHRLHLLGHG